MVRSGLLLILATLLVAIGVLSGSLAGIGVGIVGGIVSSAVAVVRLLDLTGMQRYLVGAGAIAAIAGVVTVLVLLSNNMVVDFNSNKWVVDRYQPEAVLPASAPDRIGVPSFWIGIVCGAPPPTPPPEPLPPGTFWLGNDQLYCFKVGPIFETHFAVLGLIAALATFVVLMLASRARPADGFLMSRSD